MSHDKKINFGAGPAKIPEPVLEEAQREFLNFNGTGISILEMSHRSKEFAAVVEETKALLKETINEKFILYKLTRAACTVEEQIQKGIRLRKVPDNFEILFMQGGGTGQFAGIPLNLKQSHESADYLVTGAWSSKAAAEAAKYIHVHKAFTPTKPFVTVPDANTWTHGKDPAYVYYCANETVHGIEFHEPPPTPAGVPLVADVSSNFLGRPFDFTNHGIVFGGAQKNLGAAGLTIVIVRSDLIKEPHAMTPAVFSFKEMHENNSLYNTPPVYGIYITNLVLKWIKKEGGADAIFERNRQKSQMIYDIIDSSNGFYNCAIDPKYRSIMNVCFRIGGAAGDDALEAEFLKGAVERHMISLKGHRSVGGIRASLYNAITLDETRALAEWMNEFKKLHSK